MLFVHTLKSILRFLFDSIGSPLSSKKIADTMTSDGRKIDVKTVEKYLSGLLERNTLVFSALSCQFISNVPSAILLSQFTANYSDLLVGVNIGGVGTLISSLASLITFREYVNNNPGKSKYYLLMFSLYNFGFLIILTLFTIILT